MKQIKTLQDINLDKVDFIKHADNVYRTREYIVKQQIHTSFNEETLINHLISEDTYYLRTKRRDAEYNVIFKDRGKKIAGKRMKSAMYTRKYID